MIQIEKIEWFSPVRNPTKRGDYLAIYSNSERVETMFWNGSYWDENPSDTPFVTGRNSTMRAWAEFPKVVCT